jgi:hypothetical protein
MADLSHHYIYGTCIDYVTGESLTDTDDERYRQKLARFLVEEKGYSKADLEVRRQIETLFAGQFTVSQVDFVVRNNGKRFMVVRYGPGSLVTRERPAIAAARVLDEEQQIPYAVVTNGEDAELLDTATGKVVAHGLAAIPSLAEAGHIMEDCVLLPPLAGKKHERELRILNAYDVEVCCNRIQDSVCRSQNVEDRSRKAEGEDKKDEPRNLG